MKERCAASAAHKAQTAAVSGWGGGASQTGIVSRLFRPKQKGCVCGIARRSSQNRRSIKAMAAWQSFFFKLRVALEHCLLLGLGFPILSMGQSLLKAL